MEIRPGPGTANEDTITNTNEGTGTDTDSSTSSTGPPPKKKMYRKQKFTDAWLSDPLLGSWLEKCESNPFQAKCRVCSQVLKAGKMELLRHSSTIKHRSNVSGNGNNGLRVNETNGNRTRAFDRRIPTARVKARKEDDTEEKKN